MIDPLALIPRTLEVIRPAAERAEERVAEAAVECTDPDAAGVVRAEACQSFDSHIAHSAPTKPLRRHVPRVSEAGQRPSGQAAVVAAYPAATG